MKISPAGIRRLEDREGVRLTAYRDSRGIPTIGIGMILWKGQPVYMGLAITRTELDEEFPVQIAPYESTVNRCVTRQITQNQYDALVSFAWNIGPTGFAHSTAVEKLNEGDVRGAAQAMLLWDKPPEIKSRREGEVAQFLTPDAPVDNFTPKPPHAVVPAPAPAPSLWSRFTSLFSK